MVNVCEELRRWSDKQNPGAFQLCAMVVHEIGGSMERNSGFSSAWPPLHHQSTLARSTYYRILFCLNGGDDVTHPAGATFA